MQKRYNNNSNNQKQSICCVMEEEADNFYSPKLKSKRKTTNYHWTLLDYVNLLNVNTAKGSVDLLSHFTKVKCNSWT